MNLSEMTKNELIELVQQLQFSLQEAHKVIQYFAKDLPANRKAIESEPEEYNSTVQSLSLEQEIEKYDLYKLYENFVAADIFNGDDETTAKQNAFNTVADILAIEGVIFQKESLNKFFPEE